MKTKIGIIGICLALLLGLGLGVIGADESNTLRIAIRNWDYDTIDPHVTTFNQAQYMIQCYCDTLFRANPEDGKIYPGLVSTWEAEEDAAVWILHLRQGVTFHDGTPWNAQAFVENIERVQDPATKSKQFASKLTKLDRMEIVGPMTVKLYFTQPAATFPLIMSEGYFGFLSPTAFNNPENTGAHQRLVGTGPFVLRSERYQERVVFEKNPNYTWGPEDYVDHEGPAQIDRIIWTFIPENATRMTALLTGEVDMITDVPTVNVEALEKDVNFNVLRSPTCGWSSVFHLNVMKAPTDELAVRRALSFAIDRQALVDAIFQGVYTASSSHEKNSSPYANPNVRDKTWYDLELAKGLLEEAGWIDEDGDGIRERDGKELVIEFCSYQGYRAEAPAELIQAMWRDAGVKMNIHVTSGSDMMTTSALLDSPYNSNICAATRVDVPGVYHRFCHSESLGTTAFSHYTSEKVDDLVDLALTTTDEDVRRQALWDVQEIWMDEMLAIPVYQSFGLYATNAGVHGVHYLINGVPLFYGAYLD